MLYKQPISWNEVKQGVDPSLSFTDKIKLMVKLGHLPKKLTATKVGEFFYISERTVSRWLKAEGTSVPILGSEIKTQEAAKLLRETSLTVDEIARQVGFNSYSYIGKLFQKHFGMGPRQYRINSRKIEDERV